MKTAAHVALTISILIGVHVSALAQDQGYSAPRSSEIYNVWVPGVSGGFIYFFRQADPVYVGGSVRFDAMYSLEKNRQKASFEERGRMEVYVDIGLFASLPEDGEASRLLFRYILGVVTSFETPSTLTRNFLVPYLGIELGGIYFEGVGNGFLAVPVAGINIVTLPAFTISIDCGLMLSTVAFEDLLGLRTELHVNFVF